MTARKPERKPARKSAAASQAAKKPIGGKLFGTLLGDALLPGDVTFAGRELDEAAAFVAAAAADRTPGEPVIAIDTLTRANGRRATRIAVINDNMPFLVDSITGALTAQGREIERLLHPMVHVRRDAAGHLTGLPTDGSGKRESVIYIETRRADARGRAALRATLASALGDVRAAVEDWPKMQATMVADADRIDGKASRAAEGAALLRWFADGMLTQLGHVTRQRDGKQARAMGVCRKSAKVLLSDLSYDRAFAWFDAVASRPLLIVKSNYSSQVHRNVPFDLFIVPLRKDGKVTALSVHAGVWTSSALAAPVSQVPLMRAQLGGLMDRLGFDPHGHAGKALSHALTTLPHDLLITFAPKDLERVATSMMSLTDRPRPRLLLVEAPLRRHLSAFVWLPRDTLSTAVRLRVQDLLIRAAEAEVLDWSLDVEGSSLALIRFVLDIRNGMRPPNESALDAQLKAMVRGWDEAVEAELAQSESADRAAVLAERYAAAFPIAYRVDYGPGAAATDILRLRRLTGGDRAARLFRRTDGAANGATETLQLKLYHTQGEIALSDAVPMLENFGFRVVGEVPVDLADEGLGSIHDFELELPAGLDADALLARAEAIEDAIATVMNGGAENDPFNRLITGAALSAIETNWLRAWNRYLRQAGMSYSVPTVVDALLNAPQVTRGLVDLFLARHDPGFASDRTAAGTAAENAIGEGLARVSAINDDRLLRQFHALVEAILRCNAFIPASGMTGETALAFKIDSMQVPGLPRPVPWREVFVFSRRVEGIHLRAGPIARGGLRWSDRRDDFRTEVLGLMKAQRVKNAVIVPTGAKGGFYPKQLPNPAQDRDAWLAEGKASYQVFVRSLLSLTDNIVGKRVVHPRHMVLHDGDDPYFVVAADKGTATYSDTANALAGEFDFWLDDAFASGGSKGYDHKAMGITARGAWLSVQRHFLELGIDVQSEPVRVAGCGDMSGDVFGNGMLLSRAIKLVAAFDHRHIFIDPEPDPARSWDERKRMFDLPRSSWDDYDKKLISKGGGVWPRSLKSIPLSAEVRAILGIQADSADPDTIISAILRSQVDLLWFGGIGTYIKAEGEANIQVGDPGNDTLRVNGGEVRARVIGEGANLGCTQAGRIEFSLAGGRLNTDFIDNSAGVDCSDNEVNIKIALASAKRAGRLTEPARVKLLAAMTDDVSALVLEDNRLQALGLSIAEAAGALATPSYLRLIEMLEERGQLDRRTEGIADAEVLLRRAGDGRGLTRPELAVLLSSAKLALQDELVHSALPDDPGLEPDLVAAFPPAMHKRFAGDIREHRLRREIIATKLANRMINRMGLVHPFDLVDVEGATLPQVTAAFVAAERLFGMDKVWQSVETTPMSEPARLLLFDRIAAALRSEIADLLRVGGGDLMPSRLVGELGGGIAALAAEATQLIGEEARAQGGRLRAELAEAGAPAEQADMAAALYEMDGAVGIARLARDTGIPPPTVAIYFVGLGEQLGLDWAQAAATRISPSDTWERSLVGGLARDFQQMRLEFLARHLKPKIDNVAALTRWGETHQATIAQFRAMVTRARNAATPTPAMLAQIASQARNLLGR